VPEDSWVLRARCLWFPTSDRLETWLIPFGTTRSRPFSRVNYVLTQLAPVPPLLVLTSALSRSFCLKRLDKYEKWWNVGNLRQTMVNSLYGLDQVVPEGMSQVSRNSEVGNTKQRAALNTQLIFWHFCGNFCSVRGPLQKLTCWSRYEKRSWYVFCTSSKNCWKIGPHVRTQDLFDFFFKGFRSTLKLQERKNAGKKVAIKWRKSRRVRINPPQVSLIRGDRARLYNGNSQSSVCAPWLAREETPGP